MAKGALPPWKDFRRPLPKGKRPKCRGCGEELRPEIRYEFAQGTLGKLSRYFTGEYGFHSLFHSKTCAAYWAVRQCK